MGVALLQQAGVISSHLQMGLDQGLGPTTLGSWTEVAGEALIGGAMARRSLDC